MFERKKVAGENQMYTSRKWHTRVDKITMEIVGKKLKQKFFPVFVAIIIPEIRFLKNKILQ